MEPRVLQSGHRHPRGTVGPDIARVPWLRSDPDGRFRLALSRARPRNSGVCRGCRPCSSGFQQGWIGRTGAAGRDPAHQSPGADPEARRNRGDEGACARPRPGTARPANSSPRAAPHHSAGTAARIRTRPATRTSPATHTSPTTHTGSAGRIPICAAPDRQTLKLAFARLHRRIGEMGTCRPSMRLIFSVGWDCGGATSPWSHVHSQ